MMKNTDPSNTGSFENLSLDARKVLAESDPAAARAMALSGALILSTEAGYRKLQQRVESDFQKYRGMQSAIGESNAADPDWYENSELQSLKVEVPAYAQIYIAGKQEMERTLVYSEQLPDGLSFGSIFHAAVIYPDRDEVVRRSYALVGPNEVSYSDRVIIDPNSGERFTVVSYLSQVGQAVWGASVSGVEAVPLTFHVPTSSEPARIVGLEVLGSVA